MKESSIRHVTFMLNDGTGRSKRWNYTKNTCIGKLPSVQRDGYVLAGWYTSPEIGYGRRIGTDSVVEKNIVVYAHWKKVSQFRMKKDYMIDHRKDTWSNDDKDQTHLTPGSDEFKAREEDLERHDPMKADDKMHAELEKYNAELVTQNQKPEHQDEKSVYEKDRPHQEQMKRAAVIAAVDDMAAAVAKSVDKSDDIRSEKILYDESLVRDPDKTASTVEKDAEDYIMFGSKYW